MTTYTPAPVARTAFNGFALAAVILGAASLALGILPLLGIFLSFIPTLLAITFGIMGLVRSKRIGVGHGQALAGLIMGSLTFLLYFTGFGLLW